jgi:hypothetical protein
VLDPIDVLHRRLVSHPRTGVPENALKSAVRARAEMRTTCLAESVGDGAADTVLVALDISTLQGRLCKIVALFLTTKWKWGFY